MNEKKSNWQLNLPGMEGEPTPEQMELIKQAKETFTSVFRDALIKILEAKKEEHGEDKTNAATSLVTIMLDPLLKQVPPLVTQELGPLATEILHELIVEACNAFTVSMPDLKQ